MPMKQQPRIKYKNKLKKKFNLKAELSSGCEVRNPSSFVHLRLDKPGRQCLASNKDGDWLLFMDTVCNKNYSTFQPFLWNMRSKLKLELPSLPESPEIFSKAIITCDTTLSCRKRMRYGCWEYLVILFLVDQPCYFCCSESEKEWEFVLASRSIGAVLSDVVPFDSDGVELYFAITISGSCTVPTKRIGMESPNRSRLYQRRLVVNYAAASTDQEERDKLFLMERKPQCVWQVYEVNISQREMVRVTNQLEGIVVFLRGQYSATYPHDPDSGLVGNCIWYTEDGDDDNFYVFCLANNSISTIKRKQPHSGFPLWFLNMSNPGMKWLRFDDDEDDVHKNDAIISEELVPAEKGQEITMPMHSDTSSVLVNMFRKLPHDIQMLITQSLLSARDYSNFRLVCREWGEIARPICWRPDDSASVECPWLLSFNENNACTTLIDPNCNMTYYNRNPELSGYTIRYSKDGWLLVTKGKSTIFFFEPFSRTNISLPDFPRSNAVDWMSFSSSPTLSPNWVIIAIHCSWRTLRVVSLRSVDEKWADVILCIEETFLFSSCNPVFHDDKFYYLGEDGRLATFWWEGDLIVSNTLAIDGKFEFLLHKQTRYLVSCEDDLYLVVIGPPLGQFVRMYVMNLASLKWEEVKTLKNFSVFLSETSSFAIRITQREKQSTINLPLFVENHHLFYKLDSSEFRYYDNDDIFINREIHARNELPYSTWIEPKIIRVCK